MSQRILVLGTHNRKKGRELQELLTPLGFQLRTLADFDDPLEVVEDGSSFAENAALKATQQAVHLGHWVLGEDSGLCVDALQGAPGIYSARFSGPDADDQANNQHLLAQLADVPPEKRSAHYVCTTCLSDPQGEVRATSEGICRGRIRTQAAGQGGFGYDPLFEIVEYHRTFGEMGSSIKTVLSHRSRAIRRLLPQLSSLAKSWDTAATA